MSDNASSNGKTNGKGKYFLLLLPVAFALLVFVLLKGLGNDPRDLPSMLIGKSLPEFSAPTLDGEIYQQTDLKGPALLNVWATWCPTCKAEHDYLNELSEERDIVIYGLNYKDVDSKARQWLADYGSPYKLNLTDNSGQIGIDLGVYGAPETFLLDENGDVLLRHAGEMTEEVWQEKFQALFEQVQLAQQ